MKNTVIFDLDGTLALIEQRLHYVQNGRNQWDEFFAACVNDAVNEPIAMIFRRLDEFEIDIVSGRSDQVRAETEAWLARYNLGYRNLIMRAKGDYTADHILKKSWVESGQIDKERVLCVFDDRQRVVDMWREMGMTCLQVNAWSEELMAAPSKKGLLTLMIGPSGAGKSTFLRANEPPSHIISSDLIRADLCGDFRDQSKNDQVYAALHAMVKTRISHGLPAVVDATNLKRKDRLAIVNLADGGDVRYIVIDRPMEEKRRDGGWRNELDFDLMAKHQQTFNSQIKDILSGDGLPNVTVADLRRS